MSAYKTNVMRILDKAKLNYTAHEYPHSDTATDGVTVAELIGKSTSDVFKTLVTKGADKNYFVFVIPVDHELDLKKAAKSVGAKSVEMIPVVEINKVTGYIRGGCSPIGMKKQYVTVFNSSVLKCKTVTVSAGKIGYQIEMNPSDMIEFVGAKTADVTVE